MNDKVVERRQAMIGDVLCVQIPPGEKVFDVSGPIPRLLGTVYDGHPVINGKTCYLSTNDFLAAEAVLPKAPGVRLQ